MGLIVHHLQRSQSERVVWLCEELGLDYELKVYRRTRPSLAAPPELKALHPTGTAPIIQDGTTTLAETSAILEYILGRYAIAPSPLIVPPSASNYPDYLFWYHWALGTFQPTTITLVCLRHSGIPESNPMIALLNQRIEKALAMMNERLRQCEWLAGEAFSLADVYAVFVISTMRLFTPFALKGYEGVLAWLGRVGERSAYKRMVEKAERGEDRGVFPLFCEDMPKAMAEY